MSLNPSGSQNIHLFRQHPFFPHSHIRPISQDVQHSKGQQSNTERNKTKHIKTKRNKTNNKIHMYRYKHCILYQHPSRSAASPVKLLGQGVSSCDALHQRFPVRSPFTTHPHNRTATGKLYFTPLSCHTQGYHPDQIAATLGTDVTTLSALVEIGFHRATGTHHTTLERQGSRKTKNDQIKHPTIVAYQRRISPFECESTPTSSVSMIKRLKKVGADTRRGLQHHSPRVHPELSLISTSTQESEC